MAHHGQSVTNETSNGVSEVSIQHGFVTISTTFTDKPVKIHLNNIDRLGETLGEEKESGVFLSSKKIHNLQQLME